MACKQGIRQNIEAAKEYYKKQRQYDPFRALWFYLVNKVHKTDAGFSGLTEEEKTYFVVNILDGEAYNGGIEQFFSNSSGGYYLRTIDGLLDLGAFESLRLLREAKEIIFGYGPVPENQMDRYHAMRHFPAGTEMEKPQWYLRLDEIDSEYYKDPDGLAEKLKLYAEDKGLVEPFMREGEPPASADVR